MRQTPPVCLYTLVLVRDVSGFTQRVHAPVTRHLHPAAVQAVTRETLIGCSETSNETFVSVTDVTCGSQRIPVLVDTNCIFFF